MLWKCFDWENFLSFKFDPEEGVFQIEVHPHFISMFMLKSLTLPNKLNTE